MKKWILLIVLLVVVIVAGSIGYKALSAKQNESTAEVEAEAKKDDAEAVEATEVEATADEAAAAEENETGEDATTPADVDTAKTPAADFTVYDMDGNEAHLSDHLGRKVLVNFWATWCPPCCAELPHLQKAFEERGEDMDFMFVDLTDGASETEETVKAFLEENGYTFPVYYDKDGSGSAAYGVTAIPTTYIIDEKGNVAANYIGSMDEDTLNELLK